MEFGLISKEFYIGRYLYLTAELRKLPKIEFTRIGDYDAVSFFVTDTKTGAVKRRRITASNPKWAEYSSIAAKRSKLKTQLNKTLACWKKEYRGNLKDIASSYEIIRHKNETYTSAFWESLKEDSNPYSKDKIVPHDCIQMRSLFEADVAEILDELGLDVKYEVCLVFGNKKVYPDFAINLPEYDRCIFIEAMGMLGSMGYVNSNSYKLDKYVNGGLYPNRDFAVISGDYDYRPDHDTIRRIIGVLLDAIARQYLVKKSSC